jgi:cysteine desulfurase
MAEAAGRWANPSSPHSEGRAARAALEDARSTIAEALDWRHDIILTSGASEALAIAGRATVPKRLIGATEHDAVFAAMGADAQIVPVTSSGVIDVDALEAALASGPALVAVQHVNNETGVVQPFAAIAAKVRSAGSLLLVDASQAAGKLALPDADFIAVSAHKLGGPPGAGALLVKSLASLTAEGGQERGYRRGTQNLPGAVGFEAALRAGAFRAAMPRLAELRSLLEATTRLSPVGLEAERSPAIGAYAVPGLTSASLLVQLDLAGFAVSAGSACSSGSMKPSHVLAAMGLPHDVAASTIRISFGPQTTAEEVAAFAAELSRITDRAAARVA